MAARAIGLALKPKASKASVGFEHPAKGPNHCGMCRHFIKPNACRIVAGMISAEDWCRRFKKA